MGKNIPFHHPVDITVLIRYGGSTMELIDLTGSRFGRLVAVQRAPNLGKATRWVCQCDCGGEAVVHSCALRHKRNPTESCGCLRVEKLRKMLTTHGLSNTPQIRMWDSAKKRAKQKGLPFDLSVEDIVIPKRCPYLDIPISAQGGRQTANSPSLDRIDPDKGYVRGNVEVISYRANAIKHNAIFDEFERMYQAWKARRDRLTA